MFENRAKSELRISNTVGTSEVELLVRDLASEASKTVFFDHLENKLIK